MLGASPEMSRAYLHRPAAPRIHPRRLVQVVFLLLNAWIGVQFYLWVHHLETSGATAAVTRPPGVEGWLPIAALMNLKYWLLTGTIPAIHPAGMFLLIAFLAISWFFRKAFCSWLCPIGTLSEWLWQGGRELFGRNVTLHRWIDRPLRVLKYVLLLFFVYAVASMSADDIADFLVSPFSVMADVKMLDFFRQAGPMTVGVLSALVVLSVVTKNFWCRYLCPYGALMGLVSMLSPVRITRDPISCIDCGKCTQACPSMIPVDVLKTVRTPECTACLTCISVCPVDQALELRPLPVFARRSPPSNGNAPVAATRCAPRLTPRAVAISVAAIFVLAVVVARLTGHWYGEVPDEVVRELLPLVGTMTH
mgnify:CR=1 FL=1